MYSQRQYGIWLAILKLMWPFVAIQTASGCILPPPISEGSEVHNQPPRILPETLVPPPSSLPKLISTACLTGYTFTATVREPDAEDSTFWRFFIDYKNNEEYQKLGAEVTEVPPNPAEPDLARVITFIVDPTDPRFDGVVEGKTPLERPHTVELLVADRDFRDGRIPMARAVDEEGLTDSAVWSIELDDKFDDNCPGGGG
jgi:hypothetical protein